MYVAMVRVCEVERAAGFVVCWTTRELIDGSFDNVYNVKLWGSEAVAITHHHELIDRGESTHIVAMPVVSGHRDHVWIDPGRVNHGTVDELSKGWYYQSCYIRLIGNEVRKMCDQTQDDVYTESSARP